MQRIGQTNMQTFEGVKEFLLKYPKGLKSAALTIGNFDGIHRGHQMLLEILKQQAQLAQGPTVVMTFQPHPVKILAPEKDIFRLFSLEDQAEQLQNLGIQYLIREPFNLSLAQTSAEEFLENYLIKPFQPKVFVVGHDFHFGKARAGNAEFLQDHSAQYNFQVLQVAGYQIKQNIVSSSRIREALKIPDLTSVHELLGRNFSIRGKVEKGDGRGEKLGIPTANLNPAPGWPLPKGVYITSVQHEGKTYPSISNVGLNPTFEDTFRTLRVESFIFDLNKKLYDETIKVEFFKFLRIEKKFKDAKELIEQIQLDIKQAKDYWHGNT